MYAIQSIVVSISDSMVEVTRALEIYVFPPLRVQEYSAGGVT